MIRPFGGIASLLFCDSMAKPGFISHKMKKKSFFSLDKDQSLAYNNCAQVNSAKAIKKKGGGDNRMEPETESCEALKLKNQVCFPLYACSKELVRQYGPHLKELNLTYTQYLVMMVLWEKESVSSRELAACLHLD